METMQDLRDTLTDHQVATLASGWATVADNAAHAARALGDPDESERSILQWLVWQLVARAALDTATQQAERWVPDARRWEDLTEVARAQAVVLLEQMRARLDNPGR
jgi:hypothetical protein